MKPNHLQKVGTARWGERVAAEFLTRRGATILDRNLRVGRGEIDLLVEFGNTLVAVEVKTIGTDALHVDPIERIDDAKLAQVRALASRVARARGRRVRVDFVGVRAAEDGVKVSWRTAVA